MPKRELNESIAGDILRKISVFNDAELDRRTEVAAEAKPTAELASQARSGGQWWRVIFKHKSKILIGIEVSFF